MKKYDEKYFRRWYRDPRSRVISARERGRRVRMVAGVAEFVLNRPIASVLDIGCGEAPWLLALRKLRPRISYLGVDSSEYAVKKFGRSRGIVLGSFADIDAVVPRREFDLIVCSDVIHYLTKQELERGLPALAKRSGGVAYLDFFVAGDNIEGDMRELELRPRRYYESLFRSHDLLHIGLQMYASPEAAGNLSGMERSRE